MKCVGEKEEERESEIEEMERIGVRSEDMSGNVPYANASYEFTRSVFLCAVWCNWSCMPLRVCLYSNCM